MRLPLSSGAWLRLFATAASAVLVALAIASPAAGARRPALIRDVNPSGDSNPSGFAAVGSTLYFAANDGIHGMELWKSDGTTRGTRMVKNIRPRAKSSRPSDLVNVNGTLFFTANDGPHGRELWKSDGTKAGTVMVKDIVPGPANQFGGNSISMHERPIAIGNRLFFLRDVCCVGSSALYVSNGTATGTKQLGPEMIFLSETGASAALNGKFYFATEDWGDEIEAEIWVSNGTRSGTHRMAGSPRAGGITFLPASGQNLYFFTSRSVDWELYPDRLWKTDGTSAGTKPLTDTGELSSAPDQAVLMRSRLYFADDALWKTNGTAAGTRPISDGALDFLTVAGTKLFFTRGAHLWRSDGTAVRTIDMVAFGSRWPRQLTRVGDKVCFLVQDWDEDTWELWESNGTSGGTHAVKSFVNPEATDGPGLAVGSRLYFAADDGTHGVELWSYTP